MRSNCANLIATIEQIEITRKLWPDFFDVLYSLITKGEYGEYAPLGALTTLNEFFKISCRPPLVNHTKRTGTYLQTRDMVFSICFNILSSNSTPIYKKLTVDILYNAIRTSYGTLVLSGFEEVNKQIVTCILNNFPIPDIQLHESIYTLTTQYIKTMYAFICPSPMDIIFDCFCNDLNPQYPQWRTQMFLQFIKKVSKIERECVEISGIENKHVTKFMVTKLNPFILTLISHIDVNNDEDFQSIGIFASEALREFCKTAPEVLLEPICNFFIQFYQSQQWEDRYSAFTSMRFIAKCDNDNLGQLFRQKAGEIANVSLADPHLKVSESAALLFGDLIKYHKLIDDNDQELEELGKFVQQLLSLETIRARSGCYIISP
ncbi:putative importin beta-1 [Histomonas meleagridis]|uniref:putative importin beta-1 n=1 Tax=Histomonas meleagridis TaxID=135588 RepID=UPI00355A21FC|nr:putative importin beta-1 [Histomonas meleagridis]KAH0802110.1 putative importin beta-1 [Histomonas meleagridis]